MKCPVSRDYRGEEMVNKMWNLALKMLMLGPLLHSLKYIIMDGIGSLIRQCLLLSVNYTADEAQIRAGVIFVLVHI